MDNFLPDVLKRFQSCKDLGDKTFAQLADQDMHMQLSSASNSIAMIIQHMHGNMLSRWTNFLTEDGEKDWRQRDAEFESGTRSKAELLSLWEEGWQCLFNTLQLLNAEDLSKKITIRSERLDVTDAILRQLAHYPYHVGQIVFIGKIVKNDRWQSLSIAKGDSAAYLAAMKNKHA